MQLRRVEPITHVVQQHLDDAAVLSHIRSSLVSVSQIDLLGLRRWDDRIAAHLEGLAISGDRGWALCDVVLQSPGLGEVFVAAVRAIEDRRFELLDRLLSEFEVADVQRGLSAAFGWVSARTLQGLVKHLLSSSCAARRSLGISACAAHRVDPGTALEAATAIEEPGLRAVALRAIGELGRQDLTPTCIRALGDDVEACRFSAACSAVLLGNRGAALAVLGEIAGSEGSHSAEALLLYLRASAPGAGHAFLANRLRASGRTRMLIAGAGAVGDPKYVAWLLKLMEEPELARLAAESFTLITGVDLARGFDAPRPAPAVEKTEGDVEGGQAETELADDDGSSAEANDETSDISEDEYLAWPHVPKLIQWWRDHRHSFVESGRYFVGAPISVAHCTEVLLRGTQRQRIAAAQLLRVLQPGVALFNTSAPAWRQQRLLSEVS